MPVAICGDCGAHTNWRNQRGVRLADLSCRSCGHRSLNAASYDMATGEYRMRDFAEAKKRKGGHFVTCGFCGRRRLDKGSLFWRPPVKVRLSRYRNGHDAVSLPAGTPLCRWHQHEIVGECDESPYFSCLDRVLGHGVSA